MRRLSGWEPRTWTDYVYDDSGRLARSVTTRESEWDAEQVDLLLAARAYRADMGSHGHLTSRSTSDAAHPNNYDSPLRYVAHGPFTDWAEKAKQDRIAAYKAEAGKDANLNGLYFTVEEIGG